MTNSMSPHRIIGMGILLLVVLAALAVNAIAPGKTSAHHSAHGSVSVEPLVPVSFPDKIDARFRVKVGMNGNQIINVSNMDHVLNAKITIPPGGELPWHTHPGPAVATIQQGALTVTNASDCFPRRYNAGQGFVDPGRGNLHKAINLSGVTTVVHVTYFEVPIVDGQPRPTIPATYTPACDQIFHLKEY